MSVGLTYRHISSVWTHFKDGIYVVPTGAELHLFPVCQRQGIHHHRAEASPVALVPTNRSHDSVTSELAPGVLNLQLHFLALCEYRIG